MARIEATTEELRVAKLKIRDVLDELTEKQQKRLAKAKGVKLSGLANHYGGDWVKLMKDMTNAELARVLSKALDDNELRVVALRGVRRQTYGARQDRLERRRQSPKETTGYSSC